MSRFSRFGAESVLIYMTDNRRKSNHVTQCKFFLKGNCKFGSRCKFSHGEQIITLTPVVSSSDEPDIEAEKTDTDTVPHSSAVSTNLSHHRFNKPCRFWTSAGTCRRGDSCKFQHDPQIQEAIRLREAAEAEEVRKVQAEAEAARRARDAEAARLAREAEAARKARQAEQEAIRKAKQAEVEAERRARDAEAARIAREAEAVRKARQAAQEAIRKAKQAELAAQKAEIAKEDATKTVQRVVHDFNVVTFAAGIVVKDVLSGFHACRIRIRNLPLDATNAEVSALFTQQGMDQASFYIVNIKRVPDGTQEANIICHEDGKLLAVGLDGIEFREQSLLFEVQHHAGVDGMRASTADNSHILTISWRAPSIAFVATYTDESQARAKVRELDQKVCRGRKVKVEMNRVQAGQAFRHNCEREIIIRGLDPDISQYDVSIFSGTTLLRALKPTRYDVEDARRSIRTQVQGISKGTLTHWENVTTSAAEGLFTVRAHFRTWEQAKIAYDSLYNQRFPFIGNGMPMLRLSDPFYYSFTIPLTQYHAQAKGWNSLKDSCKETKGCSFFIDPKDRVCILRVRGTDRKAVGLLKVKIEQLAAGERMDRWLGWFGSAAGGQFLDSVSQETRCYARNDWKLRVIKLYGEQSYVARARARISAEIERREGEEQTVLLKRQSVGYFVRRGLAGLKEELGEDNVTLNLSSSPCSISIRGGEAARHTLQRVINESLDPLHASNPALNSETVCPICYDAATLPVDLACGHSYCTACLQHFLGTASDTKVFPLSCMGDEDKCHVPIPIPTIQKFIPPQQFSHLLETAYITHIERLPQQFKYCKTPDCNQVYRSNPANSAPLTVHCPSCLSSICATCHEESHQGMTCAESRIHNNPAEQERLNDQLAREVGYKKCPNCRVWIEKTEGCNHMECKCGAHICWVCMGVFEANTIYAHMNTSHGGINTVAPAEAVNERELEAEYRVQQEVLRQAALRRDRLGEAEPLREAAAAARAQERLRFLREERALAEVLRYRRQIENAQEQERLRLRREEEARRQHDAGDRWRRQNDVQRRLGGITHEDLQLHNRLETQRRQQELEVRRQAELRQRQEQDQGGWCVVA